MEILGIGKIGIERGASDVTIGMHITFPETGDGFFDESRFIHFLDEITYAGFHEGIDWDSCKDGGKVYGITILNPGMVGRQEFLEVIKRWGFRLEDRQIECIKEYARWKDQFTKV